MKALDELKEQFDSLDAGDRRWIFVCGAVAIAALVYALLVGSVVGDILGFVLAVGTGWLIRSQWQLVIRSPRHAREQAPVEPSETKARNRATRFKA